mmetsp:Transcript_2774/g.3935  ORF Transcript_2774/g.3935 Transcript_2774/m.3935 type:complete len:329 (+) Transcript_2774:135-1121(+)
MINQTWRRVSCTGTLLSILITYVSANTTCTTVDSWDALKDIIADTAAASLSDNTAPLILLCPFDIQKIHGARTNHRNDMLIIDSPIQVHCYKSQPGDMCKITSVGPKCNRRLKCQHVMEIRTSDVTLQGLTFSGAQAGSLVINSKSKGIRLIDVEYDTNASPNEKEGSIIEAEYGTSTTIIDSRFINNDGTAIENSGGTMTIISSTFVGNEATPTWSSNDVENKGGGVGGAIMNNSGSTLFISESRFVQNGAEQSGPAIQSHGGRTIDAGGNCGRENHVLNGGACDGIFDQQTSSCMSFGTLCSDDVRASDDLSLLMHEDLKDLFQFR